MICYLQLKHKANEDFSVEIFKVLLFYQQNQLEL